MINTKKNNKTKQNGENIQSDISSNKNNGNISQKNTEYKSNLSDVDNIIKSYLDFIDTDFENLYKYLNVKRVYKENNRIIKGGDNNDGKVQNEKGEVKNEKGEVKNETDKVKTETDTVKNEKGEVKNEKGEGNNETDEGNNETDEGNNETDEGNSQEDYIEEIKDESIENKKIHILSLLFLIILFINFYYFYFYSELVVAKKKKFKLNKSEAINNSGKYYSEYINNFMLQSYILYNVYLIVLILIALYYNPMIVWTFFEKVLANNYSSNIFMKILGFFKELLFNSTFTRFIMQNIAIIIVIMFINITLGKTYLDTFNTTDIPNYESLTYNDYVSISNHYSYIYYLTLLLIFGFFTIHFRRIPNLFHTNPISYYVPYTIMILYILTNFGLGRYISTILFIIIISMMLLNYVIDITNNMPYIHYTQNIFLRFILNSSDVLFSYKEALLILILLTLIISLINIKNEKINNGTFENAIKRKIDTYKEKIKGYKLDDIFSIKFLLSFLTFNVSDNLNLFI